MAKGNNAAFMAAKKCRNCRAVFQVLRPAMYAYKRGNGHRVDWYCSWKCMCANEHKNVAVEKQFAWQLRNIRHQTGLAGWQVAEYLGVSVHTYEKYEQMIRPMPSNRIKKRRRGLAAERKTS